jgi:hypothetical protein
MAENPRPPQKEKTIDDLLNKDNRMMKSPVLWFALILIPVILCFYVALTETGAATNERPAVTEYTPENKGHTPPADMAEGRRGSGPECNFKEWMGKQADAALESAFKAKNRAYRILPPGSMMTQDFSPSRVNFETDADGKVTRIWCG